MVLFFNWRYRVRVQIINETTLHDDSCQYRLWFQWCLYVYDDGTSQHGYRFMWRKDGKLMTTRGQARINSTDDIIALVSAAKTAGWGNYDAKKKEG